MGALAVILGRAGSKGVPGKNVALVGGRACAAWTIDAAKDARLVERVVVSTDSAELQRIAFEMGVDVIARPAELATDRATVDDAARHAVRTIDGAGSSAGKLDPIVILYANVPVRPEGLIDRCVELVERTGADSAQSYARVGKNHPWWMVRIEDEAGAVRPWEGEVLNHGVHRRQDLPGAFVPDGGALVVRRRALFLEVAGSQAGPHAFFGRDRRGVVTGEGEVVDIDSPVDLVVADALLSGRVSAGAGR